MKAEEHYKRSPVRILSVYLSLLSLLVALSQSHGFASVLELATKKASQSIQPSRGHPLRAIYIGSLFGKKETIDPNKPKRIFEIPCDSVKIGGLRFALGLHLIGQQGNPEKGTWMANQANDGVLDMFFKDETGMFSVTLTEKSIAVDRYGPRPSLQYVLQESIVLHDFLDELHTLAFEGDDIEDENRLLKPKNDAIDNARGALPARRA